MKNTISMWLIAIVVVLFAGSARASNLCGSVGSTASKYCSLSPSRLYLQDSSSLPRFALFDNHLFPVAGLASRPMSDEGMGRGPLTNNGVNNFFKLSFYGGYGRWWRNDGWTWSQGYSDSGSSDLNLDGTNVDPPLADTPEPFTLLLFGTGLLAISFLVWRRNIRTRNGC
jgi:hypothetical protein